jgi:hypothetical protein
VAKTKTTVEETIDTPAETPGSGKGHATPSRKEREAANKRPLVPGDRKEAAKEARRKQQEVRDRARVGMANGEEKYLPVRDRGPQRKFVRDWVDARWSLGEFLIPVMFLVLIATIVPLPDLQAYTMLALYAFIAIVILDCLFLGWRVMRAVREKFGVDKVERGLRWYATMRSLQFRRLRLPKPQVKRGQYPS